MEKGEESCSLPLTLSEKTCCNSRIEKSGKESSQINRKEKDRKYFR